MKSKKKDVTETTVADDENAVLGVIVDVDSWYSLEPVTEKGSKGLIDVCGVPLLTYSLRNLQVNEITDCYVVGSHDSSKLKQVCSAFTSVNMKIHPLISESSSCLGDALRELDGKAVLQKDFVLMSGDTVSNAQLIPVIERHRVRCKMDRGCVMTIVLRKCQAVCIPEIAVVVQKQSGRLLHHKRFRITDKKFSIPLELMQQYSTLEIRTDLIDPGVSICTPAVPPLFSDNFDFQSRDDFVKGILENEEILGSTIYVEVLEDPYMDRVTDLPSLLRVSKDVMKRFAYPQVPDLCLNNAGLDLWSVYQEAGVKVGERANLNQNVILREHTKVESDVFLSNCVIGKHCVIEKKCNLKYTILHDNVKLGPGCSVIGPCIIGTGVKIGKNVKIESGCLIGPGVVLGTDACVPENTKLTSKSEVLEDDGFGKREKTLCDKAGSGILGVGGEGYIYNVPTAENVGGQVEEDKSDDVESSEEEQDGGGDAVHAGEDIEELAEEEHDLKLFYQEMQDSLIRGDQENISTENIILEINSSKHAYNATISEISEHLALGVLETFLPEETVAQNQFLKLLSPRLRRFIPVLQNYIRSQESERDVLKGLTRFWLQHMEEYSDVVVSVMKCFYNEDILSDGSLGNWYEHLQDERLKQKAKPLMEWLEDEDSDSE